MPVDGIRYTMVSASSTGGAGERGEGFVPLGLALGSMGTMGSVGANNA